MNPRCGPTFSRHRVHRLAWFALSMAMVGTAFAQSAPKPTLDQARADYEKVEAELRTQLAKLDRWMLEALDGTEAWPAQRDFTARTAVRDEMGIAFGLWTDEQDAAAVGTVTYYIAAAQTARSQLELVNALLHPIGPRDSWTGVWRDDCGGELRIVERGGAIYFTLWVARGPTHHTGGIAGRAPVNELLAHYTDRYETVNKPEGFGETWLNFKLGGPTIQVDGANTGYYHGARAYFDGRYVRVEGLSDQDAAEVVAGHVP